jgi:hypothetical protein
LDLRVFGRGPRVAVWKITGVFMAINVSITATVVGRIASGGALHADSGESPRWQAPAQWHRFVRKTVRGTLLVDHDGVEFRSAKFHER